MDVRTETSAAQYSVDPESAADDSSSVGLSAIYYGLVAGPVATALGAVVSIRLTGTARAVVWVSATSVLAAGAIYLAQPGMELIRRCLRSVRLR